MKIILQTYQEPLLGTSIGIVFGSFAPLHQGHLDEILRTKKENDDGSKQVEVRKFTIFQWFISICITVICTIGMGFILNKIGSHQAYTDAATNIFAIFGQLLMIKRFREQWIWWLLIDLFCTKMWFVAGNWSMVAMYIAWTANCIYGWYNWSKLNKQNAIN